MKRLLTFLLLLSSLAATAVGSCFLYVFLHRDTGAVPSALLAGVTTLSSYKVRYAGPESDGACLRAYRQIKETTRVRLIEDQADSRYNCAENLVYLTPEDAALDSVAAVHEYGHALDRALYGQGAGYFSRQPAFEEAYAADLAGMPVVFDIEAFFRGESFRNLAVSDILFAVLYEEEAASDVLEASYQAAGIPYWRHETEYMASEEHRRTEVFADIFTILLSDDTQAKAFLQSFLPASTAQLQRRVESYVQ